MQTQTEPAPERVALDMPRVLTEFPQGIERGLGHNLTLYEGELPQLALGDLASPNAMEQIDAMNRLIAHLRRLPRKPSFVLLNDGWGKVLANGTTFTAWAYTGMAFDPFGLATNRTAPLSVDQVIFWVERQTGCTVLVYGWGQPAGGRVYVDCSGADYEQRYNSIPDSHDGPTVVQVNVSRIISRPPHEHRSLAEQVEYMRFLRRIYDDGAYLSWWTAEADPRPAIHSRAIAPRLDADGVVTAAMMLTAALESGGAA